MQKITPFLWFDTQAEEAAAFYTSVFKNAKILSTIYYPEGSPMPAGTVLTVQFELEGIQFTALNGGPEYKFTEAVSFAIDCQTQEEVDELWGKLTADGGEEGSCGWLKDKYGVSWQVVPSGLDQLLSDSEKGPKVMQVMMPMKKLDIKTLVDAANK
jgi:predicted 3-demethylubiquinone-9 3-methyltransferase (glyoxalase superfamily)